MSASITKLLCTRIVVAVFLVLALTANNALAQSLFAEANYSDSQYSALVEQVAVTETDLRDAFTNYQMYRVTVQIIERYFGPLKAGAEIEVQINVPYIARSAYLDVMSAPFILSFCSSGDGVYYTNRDYLVLPANEANLAEFRRLAEEGTDFDGRNDCTNTNLDLGPITIDPDVEE